MKTKLIVLLSSIIAVCAAGALVGCKVRVEFRHNWQSTTIIKQATCTEGGTQSQTCTQCNTTRKLEIPN